jgi:predicted nuclease of predicted toxin-antitoxin system
MNLLADENIPVSIVRALLEDRHDVMWVRDESPGVPDIEVLQLAHRKNRIILTFDKDFGELAIRDQVAPCPGIILVRVFKKTPPDLARYIRDVIGSRQDWAGHFSVIEDERIRMRPLSR